MLWIEIEINSGKSQICAKQLIARYLLGGGHHEMT